MRLSRISLAQSIEYCSQAVGWFSLDDDHGVDDEGVGSDGGGDGEDGDEGDEHGGDTR